MLLQSVDVGFGKNPALSRYGMQLYPVISLLAELVCWDFELGIDLVDYCAGAAGALIVHRRNLLLAPGGLVFFEDDDLGVLSA